MRLIDADELITLSEFYGTFIDRKSIETAPTVKAIPIDMLEDLLEEEDLADSMKLCVAILIKGYEMFSITNEFAGRIQNGQQ